MSNAEKLALLALILLVYMWGYYCGYSDYPKYHSGCSIELKGGQQ